MPLVILNTELLLLPSFEISARKNVYFRCVALRKRAAVHLRNPRERERVARADDRALEIAPKLTKSLQSTSEAMVDLAGNFQNGSTTGAKHSYSDRAASVSASLGQLGGQFLTS